MITPRMKVLSISDGMELSLIGEDGKVIVTADCDDGHDGVLLRSFTAASRHCGVHLTLIGVQLSDDACDALHQDKASEEVQQITALCRVKAGEQADTELVQKLLNFEQMGGTWTYLIPESKEYPYVREKSGTIEVTVDEYPLPA